MRRLYPLPYPERHEELVALRHQPPGSTGGCPAGGTELGFIVQHEPAGQSAVELQRAAHVSPEMQPAPTGVPAPVWQQSALSRHPVAPRATHAGRSHSAAQKLASHPKRLKNSDSADELAAFRQALLQLSSSPQDTRQWSTVTHAGSFPHAVAAVQQLASTHVAQGCCGKVKPHALGGPLSPTKQSEHESSSHCTSPMYSSPAVEGAAFSQLLTQVWSLPQA
jgi:hypothetical protein